LIANFARRAIHAVHNKLAGKVLNLLRGFMMTSSTKHTAKSAIEVARDLVDAEIHGLEALKASMDQNFSLAVDAFLKNTGYCVVTGVGKSGHIGSKIAATFASTGTPAFFVHPTEASHGDLGMLNGAGALLAISNSGDTREMRDILSFARRVSIPIVGITKRKNSLLGSISNILLALPDVEEACPNGLAPTTSTTMTLALGDALAVAVMEKRGFTSEDFGMVHPGGKLGLQLQRVSDWLIDQPSPPVVTSSTKAGDVISAIADGGMGCVGVLGKDSKLLGCITDGDLRRAFDSDFFEKTAGDIMSSSPAVATPDMRMADVIGVMTDKRISNLLVVDDASLLAIIHMKDLLKAGYL
jgi:arabinose-5-phosphate isomerase